MNGKSNFWVCLFVLAAGIALISMHSDESLLQWLVVILGWLFVLPGAIILVSAVASKKRRQSTEGINLMSAIGSLIVGLIMIIWPQVLVGVFVYVLAALLIALGLWQIVALSMAGVSMPWWLYLLPVLSLLAGIALLATPLRTTESMFTLVAGIAMVCIGANGVIMAVTAYAAGRDYHGGNLQ
ncbi:MAG: DUF308 domain-containing protein [Muribaculum sp.]|nr:DUF308 domain-containing protein [Muribaculaceae bacterium]MCM1080385.1 DUF308 domain-containing protein [Muribaculum sp.]